MKKFKKAVALLAITAMVLSLLTGLAAAQSTKSVRVYDDKGAFVASFDDLAEAGAMLENGYTVRLAEGEFDEDITISKEHITIIGLADAADVVINGKITVDGAARNFTLQKVTVAGDLDLGTGRNHLVKDCVIISGVAIGNGARYITVTGNTFKSDESNDASISIADVGTGVKINQNNILALTGGFTAANTGKVDMTLNYWGNAGGPTVTGATQTYGAGSAVTAPDNEELLLQPWLNKEITKGPAQVFAVKNKNDNVFFWNIADALANAEAGDTIVIGPFAFDESVAINNSLTLEGADAEESTIENVISITGGSEAITVNIKDLTVEPGTDYGIEISGSDDAKVTVTATNVTVSEPGVSAIFVQTSTDNEAVLVTANKCTLDTGDSAAILADGEKAVVNATENTLQQTAADAAGVRLRNKASLGQFSGNTFKGLIEPERLAGDDRYKTAIEISGEWYYSGVVYMARGDDFADALAGVMLAADDGAPVLLTRSDSLPAEVLQRMGPLGLNASSVRILGGTGAVSANVESQLKNAGFTVERLAGATRYETAVAIAEKLGSTDSAVVVRGDDFADALAAGPLANALGAPILLVQQNSIPAAVKAFIADNQIGNFYIVGGSGVVSNAVMDELLAMEDTNSALRIYGNDRYETAYAVVKYLTETFPTVFNPERDDFPLFLARGDEFADALAGGALACRSDVEGVIVLTQPFALNKFAQQLVAGDDPIVLDPAFTILGGTGAVSEAVADAISALNFTRILKE